MKLIPIAFQSGKIIPKKKYSQEYFDEFCSDSSSAFKVCAEMIYQLLTELERDKYKGTKWVCTSHENIILHEKDEAVYGDTEHNVMVVGVGANEFTNTINIQISINEEVNRLKLKFNVKNICDKINYIFDNKSDLIKNITIK